LVGWLDEWLVGWLDGWLDLDHLFAQGNPRQEIREQNPS